MMRFSIYLILLMFLFVETAQADVYITEIMFNTSSSQQEWIEIFNDQETINLQDWTISDNRLSPQTIISTEFLVPPNTYLVLVRNLDEFRSQFPNADSSWVIETESSLPGLNNDEDAVILYDANAVMIDSVAYSDEWGGDRDLSLERISIQNPSNDANNWGSCLDDAGGTPTFLNSLAPCQIDLAVFPEDIHFDPENPRETDIYLMIRVVVWNVGLTDVEHFHLVLSDTTEQIILETIENTTVLPANQFIEFSITYPQQLIAGDHPILVEIDFPDDQNLTNNQAIKILHVSLPPMALVINEIMYAPNSGLPEWIELYNPSTTEIDLQNWHIFDAASNPKLITSQPVMIPPDSFLVLVEDAELFLNHYSFVTPSLVLQTEESFPSLNNNGDLIGITDEVLVVIDSVDYLPSWGGGNGVSLERINPQLGGDNHSNWGTCLDSGWGATPALQNSVAASSIDLAVIDFYFSPAEPSVGDDLTLTARIQNAGLTSIDQYTLSFYDVTNDFLIEELMITTLLEVGSSQDFSVVYQNITTGDYSLRVDLTVEDDGSLENNQAEAYLRVGDSESGSIVINELMFDPVNDAPEWIELFNDGSQDVNLRDWMLSEGSQTTYLITQDHLWVSPNEFVILTSDENAFLQVFPDVTCQVVAMNRFPILNNTGDTIILLDSFQTEVDRVDYVDDWGDLLDVSLERRQPFGYSNDPNNWGSCVLVEGGTPCAENSIFFEYIPEEATISVSPNPFSPDGDGKNDVLYIKISVPASSADVTIEIYDVRGRLVRRLLNEQRIGVEFPVTWDGRDDDENQLPIGIYIVYFEAVNWMDGTNVNGKTTVVLAKSL